MNFMQNMLEKNHDIIGSTNSILTDVFTTPDGLNVKIRSEMVERCGALYPEFGMFKV